MAVSFDRIAASIRKPGVYIEENDRRAVQGTAPRPSRVLLIGLISGAATMAALTLTYVPDAATGETYCGRGSSLSHMVAAYKKQDPHTPVYVVGIANPTGTNANIATVFSGTSTAAGTLHLRVAGRKISIPVPTSTSASALGDLIAAEIALARNTDLPVTAANSAGTVTWTSREDGVHGNHIRIVVNGYNGEPLPAGITLAGGDTDQYLASGAGTIDIDTALAATGNEDFQFVITGLVDTTNLGKLQDWADAQWAPSVRHECHTIACYTGTVANTTTAGNAENSKHMTLFGPGVIPQTNWVAAAVLGARVVQNWNVDPNRPIQNVFVAEGGEGLYGIDAPLPAALYTSAQVETLLTDGIACVEYPVGRPMIVRTITTYQTNASSVPSTSYLDTETMLNLMNIFYQVRARLSARYPNSKAAADGTSFSPGIAVVQPSSLRGELLDLYNDMIEPAWVQDAAGFAEDLLVEINGSDPGRFDVVMAPRLVMGARVFAVQVQFILGVPS